VPVGRVAHALDLGQVTACIRANPAAEVAQRVRMRATQLARYERGDVRDPLLSTITRIARGLGVSVAELLRGLRP
jgi:transcriptional regulator with XRE-family HTH domain